MTALASFCMVSKSVDLMSKALKILSYQCNVVKEIPN